MNRGIHAQTHNLLLTTENNYKKKQAENSFIIREKRKPIVYDINLLEIL